MKKHLLSIWYILIPVTLIGCDPHDGPKKEFFEKTIGEETGSESAQFIESTRDGGFIITGYTNAISGNDDIYLVKTDERFHIEWSKTVGGSLKDRGYEVHQTSNGGYVAVGTISLTSQNTDMYVIRTNEEGSILWYKKIAQYETEEGYSVKETADGGFIVAGMTKPAGDPNSDIMLTKLTGSGSFQWSRIYGSEYPEIVRSVETTQDNGFVVVGEIRYNMPELGDDSIDVIFYKFNSNGEPVWQNLLDHDTSGGYSKDRGYSIKRTSDNGFIIGASSNIIILPNYSHNWGWLIKTDDEGHTQWSTFFDEKNIDRISSVDETKSGDFIVTGRVGGTSPGRSLYLAKFNASGVQLWSRSLSGQGSAEGSCVRAVDDRFVVAGYTSPIVNRNDGKSDIYILNTDAEGNIE